MPPRRSTAPRVTLLREFELIERLHRQFGKTGRSVHKGIGDDAAVLASTNESLLLLTTDLLAEGIHFDRRWVTWEDVGYKAAVANLSDIAAMGGIPTHLVVALAIPRTCTAADIRNLYRGLARASRPYRVDLVGGDTSASRHGVFLSVALTGLVEPGRVLTREGARPGDLLYVTGTLGDSLAGLLLLRALRSANRTGRRARQDTAARYLIRRHLRPTPRIPEGRLLSRYRLATAAIDVSDGLSGDLAHVCRASGVGVELDAAALPLSAACLGFARAARRDPVELALTGGEDYELLFTVSSRSRTRLQTLARHHRVRVSQIGMIRPKAFGMKVRTIRGDLTRLRATSYQHFHPGRPQR